MGPSGVSSAMRRAWLEWQARPANPEAANAKEDALKIEAQRLGLRQTELHDLLGMWTLSLVVLEKAAHEQGSAA